MFSSKTRNHPTRPGTTKRTAHNRGLSRIRDVADHLQPGRIGGEVTPNQVRDVVLLAIVVGQTVPPGPRLARLQA
ncbi:MAG TPA: hypothetical protein VMS92_00870, partial [Mycobacterium sp.]|nr:hypothetical protein [Mycobacterium sp.]